MTNLEAIKSKTAGYPLKDSVYEVALLDHKVNPNDQYGGTTKGFELATADVYQVLVTAPTIQEGGYQMSLTDKSNFMKMADAIYRKWGVSGNSASISDATSFW